jgi:hypothetical protein
VSVPVSRWKWDGHPGHLIVSYNCHFWLNTTVGRYRVSTIGDYQPNAKGENEEIGIGRTHETYVFETDEYGAVVSYSEVDTDVYNDCEAAVIGHMKMCRKYARLQ